MVALSPSAATFTRSRYVVFLARARRDWRRVVGSVPLWAILALGSCNLLAALVFGLDDVVSAPRFVLQIIYANFGIAVGSAVVVSAVTLPAVRPGSALAARCMVLALVVCGYLALAGIVLVAFQLWQREWLDVHRHLGDLLMNLGWWPLHLIALVVFAQTVLGRWFGAAAAAALFVGANLAADHLLIRYGTPVTPWSAIGGYGPFLHWHVAAGLYWSAVAVLLLTAAHVFAWPRHRWRQRLTTNVYTVGWAALVAGSVCGSWIYNHANGQDLSTEEVAGQYREQPSGDYSRMHLALDIFPAERRLTVYGRAVVVNRLETALPELHLAFPPWLRVDEVALTGELVEQHRSYRRFRLNRPLLPRETLLVEYSARWQALGLPEFGGRVPLLANGTFLVTTDVVPTLGRRFSPATTFAGDAEIFFGARVSTALNQTAIAPGTLTRAWREEDRAYFEYQTPAAIPAIASIHSGHYKILRDESDGFAIEAYYPPGRYDGQNMIVEAKRKLAQCNHRQPKGTRALPCESSPSSAVLRAPFRIVAVPDYQPIASSVRLLGFNWRRPATASTTFEHLAPAGVWPYSERRLGQSSEHVSSD